MKEREIGLFDLMFDVLLHWRGIIVSMLVGMVLLGSFSFVTSYRTSKAQAAKVEAAKVQLEQEQQAADNENAIQVIEDADLTEKKELARKQVLEQVTNVSKDTLEEELTDLQKYNVNYVLTHEKLYREKKTYIEESILMQLNPNDIKRGEITFLVSSDDLEKTYNLVKVYEDLLRSGELIELVATEMDLSTAVVDEIIALEKESYDLQDGVDTVRVRITHSEKSGCEQVAQIIKEYVDAKSSLLANEIGNHEITVLFQSMISVCDVVIMSNQKVYYADLASLESSIANYKSKFTEAEWQYYDILLNGELTDLSISKMVDNLVNAMIEEEIEEEEDEEVKQSPAEIVAKGVTVHPGVSVKYVILGAILAAFIAVFVIFVLYILNPKLRATDNLQMLYMIPQLGVLPKEEKSAKLFGFVDRWIVSIRDWNKRKFTREETIGLAAVAIKMTVEKESLHNVCLVGCELKEQAMTACEQLKAALVQENMHVDILNNVLYDAKAMSELKDAQSVVLVETAGSTLYSEITQELELLKRQDINVIGGIIIE